jgi:hypothetical protein
MNLRLIAVMAAVNDPAPIREKKIAWGREPPSCEEVVSKVFLKF